MSGREEAAASPARQPPAPSGAAFVSPAIHRGEGLKPQTPRAPNRPRPSQTPPAPPKKGLQPDILLDIVKDIL